MWSESGTVAAAAADAPPRPASRATRRLCFVAPEAFGMLCGRPELGYVGGAEKQVSLVARALAARGHAVSLVAWDYGQPDGQVCDGVRVEKMCRPDAGLPGLRFVHPRCTSLWRALRRADADVYVQRTSDAETGLTALWCRRNRRRFVYCVASNVDCLAGLPHLPTRRQRWLFVYGLRRATVVVAQTRRQQELLRRSFNIESVVVPNCGVDLLRGFDDSPRPRDPAPRLVWIGRLTPLKRPDRLLEFARLCPEIHIDVLGNGDDACAAGFRAAAAGVPNLRLHGSVPPGQVVRFYRASAGLLCTSEDEGFPNTFVEAWSCGTPVISTFDPDGCVERAGLGAAAEDVPELAARARALLSDADAWRRASAAARDYFARHLSLDAVLPRLEEVLLND